mgnify:CR=1 FL=1
MRDAEALILPDVVGDLLGRADQRTMGVGAVESLFVETSLLFVPAVAYLAVREHEGTAAFLRVSRTEDALLASCGVVTALPLLCFGDRKSTRLNSSHRT